MPTAKSLQESEAAARTAKMDATGLLQPRAALETVGPAGRYAPKSSAASATAPATAFKSQARQAAAPYPDPPRTMSAKECLKGLGSTKKFYIKSRFAVCSGASFNQVWFINNRPSGESRINFIAVGTIAKGSRTVKIRHHYLFEKTGRTGALGMILTPKATVPQKWPASARISEGGAVPGGRSWASLAAESDPGFTRTLTGKAGTGSGRDDALFAVFQPKLKLTVTGGWKMTGPREGQPFFLAPRWDKAKYLAGSTANGGATFSYAVHMPFSTKAGAPERAAAQHIKDAYTKPEKTEPKNTRKDIPGRTAGKPLTRLYHDQKRREDNRNEAIKACKHKWGPNYSEGGKKQCDEFPFSTTYEGAAQALRKYDPQGRAPKKNFSARPIPKDDNEAGGRIMSGFYSKNRIIDGTDDGFLIKVS
ncbi:NucA/NucB deoxyribonuclease domain-containing protein [Streptomyces sp. NRRL B-1347]|uniref:NucA/NucB deoxyribonuclease domain-containing protein n=1 Tax=Streptomyces sp. NRRL B-1347 TaxID=1476877 RepID=UPI00131BA27C|nr:hypothetical protein [Streptomyces sp. NRRL B-1347]